MTWVEVADRLLVGPRWIARRWRRSLLLRVSLTTVAVSGLVLAALGFLLLSRVTSGLLGAKEGTAVAEATAGVAEAQRILAAADTGASTPPPARLVDSVVTALASRAGAPDQFDILMLSADPLSGDPERGTNLASVTSVPDDLRAAVVQSQRISWTYSDIRYLDGRSVPGLVVGAPLAIPTVGPYELYYLFPLAQEQQTLDLVRGAVVATGLLLIGLLLVLAWLLTRQVVSPVRAAARTAAKLSTGQLSERMRVRGEDDLARLATAFNDMAVSLQRQIKQLETLSRVQQRFVSDVSHELRTPLTTIRMAADLMFEDRDRFDAPTARAAELLQNELDRFEALLVDLLEVSRFDAGVAVLDVESFDLPTLVERVMHNARPLSDDLGRELRLHVVDGPLPLVQGDPRRIDRIIRNLVVNALEHGDERGVDVYIACGDGAVAVTVRDYGVGLRPGEASLVFNRFWRADPARVRRMGGTGLGLAIALEDARLHGGWLEAAGEPGLGACFRLTLPMTADGEVASSPLPLDVDGDAATPTTTASQAEHAT